MIIFHRLKNWIKGTYWDFKRRLRPCNSIQTSFWSINIIVEVYTALCTLIHSQHEAACSTIVVYILILIALNSCPFLYFVSRVWSIKQTLPSGRQQNSCAHVADWKTIVHFNFQLDTWSQQFSTKIGEKCGEGKTTKLSGFFVDVNSNVQQIELTDYLKLFEIGLTFALHNFH